MLGETVHRYATIKTTREDVYQDLRQVRNGAKKMLMYYSCPFVMHLKC